MAACNKKREKKSIISYYPEGKRMKIYLFLKPVYFIIIHDDFYMLTFLSIRTSKHKAFSVCSDYKMILTCPWPSDELVVLGWCCLMLFGVYSSGWALTHSRPGGQWSQHEVPYNPEQIHFPLSILQELPMQGGRSCSCGLVLAQKVNQSVFRLL